MKKPIIKVYQNVWGNFNCSIGGKKLWVCGEQYDAQVWLNRQFATGLYELSDNSTLTPQ